MVKKLIRIFVNYNFVIGKKENFYKIIFVFYLEKKRVVWKFVKRRELEKKIVIKLLFIFKLINLIFVL